MFEQSVNSRLASGVSFLDGHYIVLISLTRNIVLSSLTYLGIYIEPAHAPSLIIA